MDELDRKEYNRMLKNVYDRRGVNLSLGDKLLIKITFEETLKYSLEGEKEEVGLGIPFMRLHSLLLKQYELSFYEISTKSLTHIL